MKSFRAIFEVVLCAVTVMALAVTTVYGQQDYPNKPIRIVTSIAGGGPDFMARILAQGISDPLGQVVVIENRGGGIASIEIVSKALPDGYTLLTSGNTLWVGPLLQKMPYDPVADFSPITLTERSNNILVVHPSLPINSVKELIAYAKAKPGTLNFATSSTGSTSHLAAELFKSMAGIDIVRVTYKGTAQAIGDLTSGQVQMQFGNATTMLPLVKNGKLRALAVTDSRPSVLVPDLPTIAASGLPGYEAASMSGIFAPAKTPPAIVNRLNQELVRVLSRPEVKEKLLSGGIESVSSTPQEFAAAIKSEMARLGKMIKELNIKLD